MKLKEAEIVGYRRFRVKDIRRLQLSFEEIMQIILGTNGSGKSSLMRLLTPLPPNHKHFHKNGSLTITLEHRGNEYVCHSFFQPKVHYSIKKNGVEMNPGGTRDVARRVCQEEFGLTQDIHDLQTGTLRFTNMETAKRREWLMRLSGNNYDYVLGVYNRLKAESNDIASTLRQTRKRLGAESAKVLSEAEIKRLQDEVEAIYNELNIAMENRAPVTRPSQEYKSEQERMMGEMQIMTNRLNRISFLAPAVHWPKGETMRNEWGEFMRPGFTSKSNVEGVIYAIKEDIAATTALLNKEIANNTKLTEQHDILTKTGSADVNELHERIKGYHARKMDILVQRALTNSGIDIDKIDPANGLSAWNSVSDSMRDLFMTIPENRERVYSSDKLAELSKTLDSHVVAKSGWERERLKAQTHLAHMENHRQQSEVKCPRCDHAFAAGYSEEKVEDLKLQIARLTSTIDYTAEQIVKLQEEVQRNRDYGDKYRAIVRTMHAWPVLSPLWDFLQAEQYLTHKPRMALSIFDKLPFDLELMLQASKFDTSVRETAILIKAAEQLGDATLNDVRKKLDDSTFEIERLTFERNRHQGFLREYEDYKQRLDEGLALGEKIRQAYQNVADTTNEMVEMMRRESLQQAIRQLQTSLARKEETLSYLSMQRALVDDIQEQIHLLTIKDEAAKMLVEELSPTKGLIAEGLLGFIKFFVAEMNDFIRRIWTYSLVVQDCAVNEDGGAELDYKFPMVVKGDEDDPVPDVSDGSTSIKDVVDLAFVVAAMGHLDMSDFPLFLDEPGASFDVAHRHTVSDMIRSIVDQRRFTQIFMVSHYEDSYGAMANADVLVLDDSNVTVPDSNRFNQHAVFN